MKEIVGSSRIIIFQIEILKMIFFFWQTCIKVIKILQYQIKSFGWEYKKFVFDHMMKSFLLRIWDVTPCN
jgi:hypothetical protein